MDWEIVPVLFWNVVDRTTRFRLLFVHFFDGAVGRLDIELRLDEPPRSTYNGLGVHILTRVDSNGPWSVR